MTKNSKIENSSFRDPSGFLFYEGDNLYRQINLNYKENYDFLISSGLYEELVNKNFLVPHKEVNSEKFHNPTLYKIIKPDLIPFISYPYEWSFSQLKDAALATIEIQKIAFKYGMSLKDSSAYNIQFFKGKPILIDTLSFEKYQDRKPWVAYKQFCQHFLAPLALMSYKDIRLNQLFRIYIDGVPLDLAANLLPIKTKFSFSLLTHIHLHAKSQKHYSAKTDVKKNQMKMSKLGFQGLIDSLESTIKKITWNLCDTEWGDYYNDTNYSNNSFNEKKQSVLKFLNQINPKTVWDIGANTGEFSQLASDQGINTISFDIDYVAVEKNYLRCKERREEFILPLLLDLTNPSPSIGWSLKERKSLMGRSPADTIFALALIHHLAISNNLPLAKIAKFFSSICNSLIIEFVPKSDSQVKRLLSTREDIFDNYTKQDFEQEFSQYFAITDVTKIKGSERTLYLMEKIS